MFRGFSRSDCDNYSASPNQNYEECIDIIPDGCDAFISEECVFTGAETGFSALPGQTTEPQDCQAYCLIVQVCCKYVFFVNGVEKTYGDKKKRN